MIMAWASRFPPEASNIFVCIISLYLNLGVGEIPAVFISLRIWLTQHRVA